MPRTPDYLEMTPFYGFFHYLTGEIFGAFFRGEVAGTEHLQIDGPFLIAANHASHLDPPIVGSQVGRQMRFFARKTLWSNAITRGWLDRTECIPVDRDSGDVGAIKRVLQALKDERAVVLFPEGTRSPDGQLQKPKAGVGLMACKSGVPVVPCRVFGSYEAFGKGARFPHLGTPISIIYGPPIAPTEYDDPALGRSRYEEAAARIFAHIAKLPKPGFPVI